MLSFIKYKNAHIGHVEMTDLKKINLISPVKLGKSLGLSRTTIYRHTDAGEIPFYKLGVNRMYDLEEVREYLKNN